MTREQKRRAREELRACGQGKSDWAGVIALAMDYYEAEDPVCRRSVPGCPVLRGAGDRSERTAELLYPAPECGISGDPAYKT